MRYTTQVNDAYRPRRRYKHKGDRNISEAEQVALVLLEYGERGNVAVAVGDE